MNSAAEEIRKIHERIDALEELAIVNIERVARNESRRICEQELAKLREEIDLD